MSPVVTALAYGDTTASSKPANGTDATWVAVGSADRAAGSNVVRSVGRCAV